MKRLFGTDGIRTVAGEPPLDPPGVRRFGVALAEFLRAAGEPGRGVVLGRDTRESGPWIRDAVAAGLASRGVDAVDAGVITTPGLAHTLRAGGFRSGVMISASHNPYHDNGLKAFGADGFKLPDEAEQRIEGWILDDGLDDPGERDGAAIQDAGLARDYVLHLEELVSPPGRFRGTRVLLDCANGSAAGLAPEIFRHHGAEVVTIGDAPDGRNINLDCGSLHLDGLARRVKADGFDIGLAFDGDADRCLAVDRRGRVVDGDYILYLVGRRMKRAGQLAGDTVVATIMSNFWLEERFEREGIRLLRAPVGDKYVLERMEAEGLVLGGEQSGHVIFREYATTGDGILTAMMLLDALIDDEQPLETILDGIVPCPQLLVNVRVSEKPDLRQHPVVGPLVSETEAELEGRGRVVLRYSGTEPLARVMVEARDDALVQRHAHRLAEAIERALGS
jgi:phosphoglucosamine mutase